MDDERLEKAYCFKHLGSQTAADRICEKNIVDRMNDGYKAWLVLKIV